MKTLQLLQNKFEELKEYKANVSGNLKHNHDETELDKVMENIDTLESELYNVCLQVLEENYELSKDFKFSVDDEDEFNKEFTLNQELLLQATAEYENKYQADQVTLLNSFIHFDLESYFNDKTNYFKQNTILNILDCVARALTMTLDNRTQARHNFLVKDMGKDDVSYHANLLKSQTVLRGLLESVGGYSLVNSIYTSLKKDFENKEIGVKKEALDGFKNLLESVFSRRPDECTDAQFNDYLNEMYEDTEKALLMCSVHTSVESYKDYLKDLAQGIKEILGFSKEYNMITEDMYYDVVHEVKQMEKISDIRQ